jgi:hypothetical protein
MSDDQAGGVDVGIGFAERRNDAIAAAFGRTEVNEQDLVFSVMDRLGELGAQADEILSGEQAFKDGELEMVAESTENLEGFVAALVVGDVVADQE